MLAGTAGDGICYFFQSFLLLQISTQKKTTVTSCRMNDSGMVDLS
jgi:hypothetical protein